MPPIVAGRGRRRCAMPMDPLACFRSLFAGIQPGDRDGQADLKSSSPLLSNLMRWRVPAMLVAVDAEVSCANLPLYHWTAGPQMARGESRQVGAIRPVSRSKVSPWVDPTRSAGPV